MISTHTREDLEELVTGSAAHALLPKSALSARAIRALLDADEQAPAT